jgi:hypothetical protein
LPVYAHQIWIRTLKMTISDRLYLSLKRSNAKFAKNIN